MEKTNNGITVLDDKKNELKYFCDVNFRLSGSK